MVSMSLLGLLNDFNLCNLGEVEGTRGLDDDTRTSFSLLFGVLSLAPLLFFFPFLPPLGSKEAHRKLRFFNTSWEKLIQSHSDNSLRHNPSEVEICIL